MWYNKDMPDEHQIIKECQSGKLEKFGLLYDSYAKKIYDFIYYRMLHKEIAQDLTSQTFLKAIGGIGSFDPDKGQFSSWLYQIARNSVIDHYRARRSEIDIESVWDLSSDENPQISAVNQELMEKLKKYLSALKPEHRQIIIMRVWDGMSYREISQVLGKSEESCKMMFSRVIGKIREEKGLLISLIVLLLLLR